MALLEVENLTAVFHTEKGSNTAVDGVSLTLEAGEILGIVGESGSVVYNGTDLLSLNNRQMRKYSGREISMIFRNLFLRLTRSSRPGNKSWSLCLSISA